MQPLYPFACFECQVTFQRAARISSNDYSAWLSVSERNHVCPNCGHALAFMGRNFRSPNRQSNKQWRAVRYLWESGFRYVGSGSHGAPALPESLSAARQFVADHPDHVQKACPPQRWNESITPRYTTSVRSGAVNG
ncbi:hypothetical protein [Photobacterium galatheae]|uniref:hypothetical protein n=1 Tax=Photobacterium galatheae TaxID=1654360 RepID=UPI000A8AB176|nr:hypothetical protein [Photobacterium galatheae]MCM0148084.1 hypothetical protein [Photobacterium galatheae]